MKNIMVTAVLLVLVLFNSVNPGPAEGCWAALTPQEMEQKADVILTGYIEEESGIYKSNDVRDTGWKVHVNYYLKGGDGDKYLTVYSPGAKGSRVGRSTDYSLDEWGRLVLLFLKKKEDRYYPLSPQGVVPLKSNKYVKSVTDPLQGSTVLKQFALDETKLKQDEKQKLEDLIKPMAVKEPDLITSQSGDYISVENENRLKIIYPVIFILVASTAYLFVKKFRRPD